MTHFEMIPTQELNQLPLFHRATIPTDYLDAMGHMNIRHYMGLFDEAAWQFFASFGMTYDYYRAAAAGAFALKQFVQYLAEVHVGETVAIRTRIVGRSAKRIHFIHFMLNESTGVLAATLEALGARAVPPPSPTILPPKLTASWALSAGWRGSRPCAASFIHEGMPCSLR